MDRTKLKQGEAFRTTTPSWSYKVAYLQTLRKTGVAPELKKEKKKPAKLDCASYSLLTQETQRRRQNHRHPGCGPLYSPWPWIKEISIPAYLSLCQTKLCLRWKKKNLQQSLSAAVNVMSSPPSANHRARLHHLRILNWSCSSLQHVSCMGEGGG